ncbi:MAG: shikimate kinase [Ruminococcaceae bacterium]|nr:shikimate kinase [Oscillospiraceae bacterium]
MKGKFGLIGKNISISLSPKIHKSFFDYEYKLMSLENEEEVEKKLRAKDFDGLNVTIPYKKTVMPFLDEISPLAEKIGSVNTVVNRNGYLFGDNTDYYGFIKTLEKVAFSPEDKKVLVLGSGGASLSIKQALYDLKAGEVITVSRSGEDNYENLSKHSDASLIVNTTPVGKYPDNQKTPLSLEGFSGLEAVIDINYNPVKSRLLIEAEKKNLRVSGGLTMLVWQAKKSAELFTGERVEDETAEKTEKALLLKMKNVVFIGMPSCGKSTVGRVFAEKTGRAFFDTDRLIEERYSKKPSEIITENGEEYFRKLETEVITDISRNTGVVISVGGGAVLKEENIDALRQNGVLVYLDRPLDELVSVDRPLSKNISALFEKRKPFYDKAADIKIKSQPTAEMTADEVIKKLGL